MEKEKRLIDADALRQSMENKIYWGQSNNVACLEAIDDAPTVDAVEVVRCKDCKHWKYDARKLCGRCDALICYRPDYFWCMYGERRTDNA